MNNDVDQNCAALATASWRRAAAIGMPLVRPLQLVLPYLAVATSTGCAVLEFTPTRAVDFNLAPELASALEGIDIQPWDLNPPAGVDSRFHVYYALEITDAAGTDQWVLRIVPTSDRITNLSRFQPGDRSSDENASMMQGLLRGFTSEFGEHSDRWLEDIEQSIHKFDIGMTPNDSVVRVFVDTVGPIRLTDDAEIPPTLAMWSRAEKPIPVIPQFFAADFPSACAGARSLMAQSVDDVTPEERHEVLSAVVRGKMKIAQGLIMIMGSPALKRIADRVMEKPSLLAYASLLTRWVASSESGFVQWIGGFAGIRFDTATPSADDPTIVQFRFEPQIATTAILKTEISGAATASAPLASAGFVTIEGINPYDAGRSFKLRLLGWSRDDTPGLLLSVNSGSFQFSPDGRSFASDRGDKLWLVPDETSEYPRSINSPNWSTAGWSQDGRKYYANGQSPASLEIVDLDASPPSYERIELPKLSEARAPIPSPEGTIVAIEWGERGDPSICLVSVETKEVIGKLDGCSIAPDAFSTDGHWLAVDRDGQRMVAAVNSSGVTLLDLGAASEAEFSFRPPTVPHTANGDETDWHVADPNGRWVIQSSNWPVLSTPSLNLIRSIRLLATAEVEEGSP